VPSLVATSFYLLAVACNVPASDSDRGDVEQQAELEPSPSPTPSLPHGERQMPDTHTADGKVTRIDAGASDSAALDGGAFDARIADSGSTASGPRGIPMAGTLTTEYSVIWAAVYVSQDALGNPKSITCPAGSYNRSGTTFHCCMNEESGPKTTPTTLYVEKNADATYNVCFSSNGSSACDGPFAPGATRPLSNSGLVSRIGYAGIAQRQRDVAYSRGFIRGNEPRNGSISVGATTLTVNVYYTLSSNTTPHGCGAYERDDMQSTQITVSLPP
jgi:hypothetical protein